MRLNGQQLLQHKSVYFYTYILTYVLNIDIDIDFVVVCQYCIDK